MPVDTRGRRRLWWVSNAEAYIDILGQELVRCLVLLQDVAVDAGAGEGATEQEAEETVGKKN